MLIIFIDKQLPEDDSEDIVSCISSSASEGPSSLTAVTAEATSAISSTPCERFTLNFTFMPLVESSYRGERQVSNWVGLN